MLDRRSEAENFVPVAADPFPIRNSAYERCKRRITGRLLHRIKARISKVADAWRKPEPQQMTQGEDVIGESGGVGVMLFDVEIGFVIQQAVEHVCGVPHGGANELDVEWGVLVRDVSVERRTRLVAVAGIN